MIRLLAMAALLLALPASAGDPQEGWDRLASALFQLSGRGDHEAAKRELMQILNEETDHRLLAETHYWLGRAYWELGEYRRAHEHMRGCLSRNQGMSKCLAIIQQIELERVAVTRVPKVFEFDDDEHGFVYVGDSGGIDVRDGALRWTINQHTQGEERIILAVDSPRRAPRGLRLSMRTLGGPVRLYALAIDHHNRLFLFNLEAVDGAQGQLVHIDVALKDFQSQAGDGTTLDLNTLERIELQEVTYYLSDQARLPAPNVIVLERFELY